MGILEFLGLRWRPRENMTYRYKRWHRRKHLVRDFPAFQGAGWGELRGWRKQSKDCGAQEGNEYLKNFGQKKVSRKLLNYLDLAFNVFRYLFNICELFKLIKSRFWCFKR